MLAAKSVAARIDLVNIVISWDGVSAVQIETRGKTSAEGVVRELQRSDRGVLYVRILTYL